MTIDESNRVDIEGQLWQRLAELDEAMSEGVDSDLIDELRRVTIESSTAGVPDCEVRGFRMLARAMGRRRDNAQEVSDTFGEALRVRGADPGEMAFARYEYALSLRSHDTAAAIQHLELCVDEFVALDDTQTAARVSLDLGEMLGATGQREPALERFEDARKWARSIGDATLVARSRDRIAAAHWELGHRSTAEANLRDALAVWEARGDRQELARAQYRLGWCIAVDPRNQQRADEALNLLDKARSAARAANDMSLVASCDEKAAWVLKDRGDHDAAIELLRAAAAVFDSLAQDPELHVVRTNLAEHLLEVGDFREGEWLLRTVMSAPTASPSYRASAATRLGRHLVRTNRAQEAVRVLEEHEEHVDLDDRIEAPSFLLAQAAAFNALSMVQATRETAEAALAHLDRAVTPGRHAEALEFLARCHDYDGDRQGAEALMGQAVALYLIADQEDDAHRLARELVPPVPGTEPPVKQTNLSVGVYL